MADPLCTCHVAHSCRVHDPERWWTLISTTLLVVVGVLLTIWVLND